MYCQICNPKKPLEEKAPKPAFLLMRPCCDTCGSNCASGFAKYCHVCSWENCNACFLALYEKRLGEKKESAIEKSMLARDPRVNGLTSSRVIKMTTITLPQGKLEAPAVSQPDDTLTSLLSRWISMLNNRFRSEQHLNEPGLHELKTIFRSVVERHPKIFLRVHGPLNSSGISYYESCDGPLRKLADSIGLFCGLFEPTSDLPEHKSATSYVFRANWRNEKVVIKLMQERPLFEQEINQRANLSKSYVLPIRKTSLAFGSRWAEDTRRFFGLSCEYGIVLDAAQRNLLVVLLQERQSFNEIKDLLQKVSRCILHLHQCEKIHCDVKPLNIVRLMDGSWRLIDLDATTDTGHQVNKIKCSSAYCPPEFHAADWDGLCAPSFDLWSLGCVMFRALARRPLLEADDRDNLRGSAARGIIGDWGYHSLVDVISEVSTILDEDGVQPRDRLAACDLLAWLLQAKPNARPSSCQMVLDHAFLNPNGILRMSWLHLFAAEGQDLDRLIPVGPSSIWLQHPLGKTPLHLAAEEGQVETVRVLLAIKPELANVKDQGQFTALQCVLHRLNKKSCEKLESVCKVLCESKATNLEMLDGSKPPVTTLDLIRTTQNEVMKQFFKNELNEKLILRALQARPPTHFNRAECDALCENESTKSSLKTALLGLLKTWGFLQNDLKLKGDYVRSQIYPLKIWDQKEYFDELKAAAIEFGEAGRKPVFALRDEVGKEVPDLLKFPGVNPSKKLNIIATKLKGAIERSAPLTSEQKCRIDEQVFVPLWSTVAEALDQKFRSRLMRCLQGVKIRGLEEKVHEDASRWLLFGPVKKAPRIYDKVKEAQGENIQWPTISSVGDVLRASVECTNGELVWQTWLDLDREFQISKGEGQGRCKNGFHEGSVLCK